MPCIIKRLILWKKNNPVGIWKTVESEEKLLTKSVVLGYNQDN